MEFLLIHSISEKKWEWNLLGRIRLYHPPREIKEKHDEPSSSNNLVCTKHLKTGHQLHFEIILTLLKIGTYPLLIIPSCTWNYNKEKNKEWINKQNNNNKKTKAEIIPPNMYSNYEEKGE